MRKPEQQPVEEITVIMRIKCFQYLDYDHISDFEDDVNNFVIGKQLERMPNQMLPVPTGMIVMYGTPEEEFLEKE